MKKLIIIITAALIGAYASGPRAFAQDSASVRSGDPGTALIKEEIPELWLSAGLPEDNSIDTAPSVSSRDILTVALVILCIVNLVTVICLSCRMRRMERYLSATVDVDTVKVSFGSRPAEDDREPEALTGDVKHDTALMASWLKEIDDAFPYSIPAPVPAAPYLLTEHQGPKGQEGKATVTYRLIKGFITDHSALLDAIKDQQKEDRLFLSRKKALANLFKDNSSSK